MVFLWHSIIVFVLGVHEYPPYHLKLYGVLKNLLIAHVESIVYYYIFQRVNVICSKTFIVANDGTMEK